MNFDSLIRKLVLRLKFLRRPSVAYCGHHGLLPGVFVRTPPPILREALRLPAFHQTTQLNQDIFALVMNQFRHGYFVEIGANDGYTLSNTVYLEEKFGWQGLLLEANPRYRESLETRKSKAVIAAVVDQEGFHEFRSAGLFGGVVTLLGKTHDKKTQNAHSLSVWGTTLGRILDENNAPEIINFISIDVEGAEVPIVEQMCRMSKRRFICGCIEHNARQTDYERIRSLLNDAGYGIVWAGQTQHDLFFVDKKKLDNVT